MSGTLSWSPQQPMPSPIASTVGPSLAAPNTFAAPLTAAWKSGDFDERIWLSYFDGSAWGPPQQILPGVAFTSGTRPALAYFPSDDSPFLHAAWKGGGEDERIWHSSVSLGGSNWAPQQALPSPIASSVGPSLVGWLPSESIDVSVDALYAAWKGGDGDDRIWFSLQFLGTSTWALQEALPSPVASSMGPSLTVYGGTLYAAWRGGGDDERLWFSFNQWNGASDPGPQAFWVPQQEILPGVAFSSGEGPSLAQFNDRLYAAWKGGGDDERLWYSSWDGSEWAPQQQILPGFAFSSGAGPSLAVLGGDTLYAAWKGGGSDERIWWASAS